ncbi:hypothetical protein LJC56_06125 [Christensenellaceae bacterium OttesenSCG-928-K19]|nr:hypothetical protein [Christensenellaceae bacterium OttesenSCG-928-K19]
MKKIVYGFLAAALMLGGCTANVPENEISTPPATATAASPSEQDGALQAADDNGMWSVELLFAEMTDTLAGTQAVVQYSGEVETVETNDSPKPGNAFLLLELLIEKMQNGSSSFTWENAYVEDGDGNQYMRHDNDTFLSGYNLPRLKSVELKIGANQGFACYEIPENVSTDCLWFVYDGTEGTVRVKITL